MILMFKCFLIVSQESESWTYLVHLLYERCPVLSLLPDNNSNKAALQFCIKSVSLAINLASTGSFNDLASHMLTYEDELLLI